jgi:hypothetical protein
MDLFIKLMMENIDATVYTGQSSIQKGKYF